VKKLLKMLSLDIAVLGLLTFCFFNPFFQLGLGIGAMITAATIAICTTAGAVLLYGNVKILLTDTREPLRLEYSPEKTFTLDDCERVLSGKHPKTFERTLQRALEHVRKMKRKKAVITDILLQKFDEGEMSYIKFKTAVENVEKVMCVNMRSMLSRISAFDEEEFNQIRKEAKFRPSPTMQQSLEIYLEYITFAEKAVEQNEEILLKLDRLLAEVSKFNTIDSTQLGEMSAMQELESLITDTKWYK
jgi:hypothetical protein